MTPVSTKMTILLVQVNELNFTLGRAKVAFPRNNITYPLTHDGINEKDMILIRIHCSDYALFLKCDTLLVKVTSLSPSKIGEENIVILTFVNVMVNDL